MAMLAACTALAAMSGYGMLPSVAVPMMPFCMRGGGWLVAGRCLFLIGGKRREAEGACHRRCL
ncbi:MAG TPA: hypothetical protein VHV08_06875 [Pirellulales bacterium]|nr:hypothetical protein [Pirellulales bacterium]